MKFYAGAFQQRTSSFYGPEQGLDCTHVTAVAYDGDGTLYAGTAKGLFKLSGEKFVKTAVTDKVAFVYGSSCGRLWVGTGNKITAFKKGKIDFTQELDADIVKLDEDDKSLWLVTSDVVYKFNGKAFERYSGIEYGQVTDMTVFGDGRLYVVNPIGILAMHGKRPHWGLLASITCDMPECTVNTVCADKLGHMWIGTDIGVLLYDSYGKWYNSKTMPYLTKGNILTITLGADGTRYIGTEYGIVIQKDTTEHCYVPCRWIPDAKITEITANADGSEIWVATENGLSCIKSVEMTLAKKAEYLEKIVEKYYIREGYCTNVNLKKPCDITSGTPEITDNDGLWTGHYMAMQSFRYAVTGDEDAREKARRASKATLKLMSITGIPGFTARAYRRPGEDNYGNGNPEWHRVTDEIGELEWKGETSSDEMVGHFFGASTYYDLCADEDEKKTIAKAISAIVDHILDNNYTLCDADGLSTTWAHWAPHELNRNDMWFNERGVNSLEMMTMLRTAYHMTGDQKYLDEYKELVTTEHYALNAARHKVKDAHVTHIDDNLCFSISLVMFRYETDPHIRQLLMLGLRHHWEYERIERAPMWNLAYGAITGDFCDLDKAIRSLEEIPLDFVCHEIKNSRRPDLTWDVGQELFDGEPQLVEPLPYDEKPINGLDANPFRADEQHPNFFARCPTIYLLPYWLGRYYGLIGED